MTKYTQPQFTKSTYPPAQPPPPSNWKVRPPSFGPPPIPAGVPINPAKWEAGCWSINPAYVHNANPPPPPQFSSWIPSHHWKAYQPQRSAKNAQQPPQQPQAPSQQAQQAPFNPFKRVPKPPSAEYLATELSDNPLGLENMIPVSVEEYYRQGHQTPWIWKPSELEDDDSPTNQHNPSNPTSSYSSVEQGRRHSESDLNREPESFTAKRQLELTFSSKIVRTPEHYRNDSTHTPSPKRTFSYSSVGSLDSQMSQLSMNNSSTSTSPSSVSRHSSMPMTSSTSFSSMYSASPTKAEFSSAPMVADQLSDEPDSILSPLILSKTPLLSGSMRTLRNHPNPLLATQSLDTIPEGLSSSNAVRASSNPTPRAPQQHGSNNHQPYQPSHLQHSNTMPNLSQSPYDSPSGPPTVHKFNIPNDIPQMVIPLTTTNAPQVSVPPKKSSRDREIEHRDGGDRTDRDHRERGREWDRIGTRHTTYVDPHITSTGTPSPRSRVQSRPSSRPSSAHASPVRHATNITPPTYPTSPPSSVHSNVTSSSNSSRPSNPLPPPPQLVQRQPILPIQRTPPPRWRERLRRGFWNRRGDFLTADGYIVYAPADKAYPKELGSYPEETVGYQDHNHQFTVYVTRPELPQSLPKHGQPPECPYDAFVVYEYL